MSYKQKETAREFCKKKFTKHGMSNTRIYRIWRKIKERCNDEKSKNYKNYGQRGITICDDWCCDKGFENFYKWSMENGYADELSIDRIDNYKGYSPDNCRWVSQLAQQNNRRNNIKYLYNGEMLTIPEISRRTNINKLTLYCRLNYYGYSLEKALSKEVKRRKKNL